MSKLIIDATATSDATVNAGGTTLTADSAASTQVVVKGVGRFTDVNVTASSQADASVSGGTAQVDATSSVDVTVSRYPHPVDCPPKRRDGDLEFLGYQKGLD
jgi:hypothetical protein